MTNGQGDFIGDNEIEDENVHDYESCSIGAEVRHFEKSIQFNTFM